MSFLGKVANLAVFPGAAFIVAMGLAARAAMSGMGGAVTGAVPAGPVNTFGGARGSIAGECVAAGGPLHAVQWLAPVVKLLALSWAVCIIFGFMNGDLVLLLALLLLASGADVMLAFSSANPRVRQNARSEAACMMGWAVPLALAMASVSLRTGEVTVSAVIGWQAANGALVTSAAGGVLDVVAGALGLAGALVGALCFARLRPLGAGLFDDPPLGIAADISGAPLAMLGMSAVAALFVAPLTVAFLFFAGPASTSLEVSFWVLKVAGLVIVLGAVDAVSPRMRSRRALGWSAGLGGLLALAGLVVAWIGAVT